MLPFETLTTFVFAATLLALAPGPDNIFVLTQSAISGARSGVFVVLGLCSGLVVHSVAVALGLAAVIATSATAFGLIKLAGAGYLLFLAYKSLSARHSRLGGDAVPLSGRQLYRRGFIMNITNPKVAIFFLAFFPQFLDTTAGNVTMQVVQLGVLFMTVTFGVFSAVALAAGRVKQVLVRSPRAEVWINRLAGVVFIGLAGNILLAG